MADHNNTRYYWRNGYGIRETQCMMDIRKKSNTVDLYIPFEWLNEGISDEDVVLWNKIGNDTLFPAELEKVNAIYTNTENKPKELNIFKGLRITCKKDYKFRQSDARQNVYGVINYLSYHRDGAILTHCSVYKYDTFSGYKGYNDWNGFASDHQLYETGECLDVYVKRILSEQPKVEESKSDYNSYKVTIDCSKALSDNHKLAILTFYRFLWSCHFYGLIVDTLNILKSDSSIEPWDALYYALSKKDYWAYYGLLFQAGYVSMEDVKSRLPRGESINLSFSNAKKSNFTLMGVSDYKSAIEKFKGGAGKPFEVECITDKLKTVTKGKKYQAECSMYDNSYLVKNNDYCRKHLLKTHFKVV